MGKVGAVVENVGGLARCALVRVTHVAVLDVIQKVSLGIKTIHAFAVGKTHVPCLFEGLAIELGAAVLDVWFGLGRERRNARDESASEGEVGTSVWRLDRRLEKSIDVGLSWLGTGWDIGIVKVGFLNSIDGFGVRAFKDVDAADVGLVAGNGVASDNALGRRVVAHVAVVTLVIADENARLRDGIVVLIFAEILFDIRVARAAL